MKRPHKAFTLVEVIIAAFILSLILTIAVRVIIPALHLVQEGSVKVDMEEQGMVALQHLFYEMQKTTPDGVSLSIPSISTDPMIVATNPIQSLDAGGFPVFTGKVQVFYWEPGKRRLFRKEFPPTPPAIVVPFSPVAGTQISGPNLGLIIGQSNGTERSMCLNVDLFMVEKELTTGGEVYRARLQASQVLQDKTIRAEAYRKLFLRNHASSP